MSSLSQDLVYSTNNIISKNLSKIKNKLNIIKSNLNENEEDRYDQFYCKINIYFTSLINKIRLKYIDALEQYKIKIKQYEKDILELLMENILLKIENNFLKNKTGQNIMINSSKIKDIYFPINNNNKFESRNYNENNITNLRKQFYRSQENINNTKNKSVDLIIKYNGIKNSKVNNILRKKNHSSNNNKLKRNKMGGNNLLINLKNEIINNLSNKSSNPNYNNLIKQKNNSDIYKNYNLPLSCEKNKKVLLLDEIEQNIIKHKNTHSQCNIRKIKDEMDSIIKKKNNIYNNYKIVRNNNIINGDLVEISEKFSSEENLKNNNELRNINNINNNISNNIIHNTSINIFNSSKGLYSINNISYKNNKNESKNINNDQRSNYNYKQRENKETSLKNIYNNLQTKNRLYNNTKFNYKYNNTQYDEKLNKNINANNETSSSYNIYKKNNLLLKKLSQSLNKRKAQKMKIILPSHIDNNNSSSNISHIISNGNNNRLYNIKNNFIYNKTNEHFNDNSQNYMSINDQRNSFNYNYSNAKLNFPINKSNNIMSRNNINSFYNNNSYNHITNSNKYLYYNTEYSIPGEMNENLDNLNNNVSSNLSKSNIISIQNKNKFIHRNKSFNCLLKLKKIIDNKNHSNEKNNKSKYENCHQLKGKNNMFYSGYTNNNYLPGQKKYNLKEKK